MSFPYAPSRNLLLQALPPLEREAVLAQLRQAAVSAKTVCSEPGKAIESVHFPLDGVVSLVTPSADGIVQLATIGNEGIVGCAPHAPHEVGDDIGCEVVVMVVPHRPAGAEH